MSTRFKLPDELDINSSNKKEAWRTFKQFWDNYEIATGLQEKDDRVRVAVLLTVIGKESVRIYNTFEWRDEEEMHEIAEVLDKFEQYCTPKTNLTYERYKFNIRK